MINQEIDWKEYFSEVIAIWRECWNSASDMKQEIMHKKKVYPFFTPPCQVYVAHIDFPLDIILVKVIHDKNEPDRTIQVLNYSENDIPNLPPIFLGEDKSKLENIIDFASEIYKADLEKGQEFKGGGGGSSRSSGEYEEMYHISHYWRISPKKYVIPLFRGYMQRTTDQISKIAERRRDLQNRILEILYEFQKEDFLAYYQVSNFCSQLGISEQELRKVLTYIQRKGYISMNEMREARLTSSGMDQIKKESEKNNIIQLNILHILYNNYLDDPDTTISRESLLDELSIPENLLFMNIIYLKDLGQVHLIPYRGGVIFASAQITTEGITRWEEYNQQPIDTYDPMATQLTDDAIIPADLVSPESFIHCDCYTLQNGWKG